MPGLLDFLTNGAGAYADYYAQEKGIESARKVGAAAQQIGEGYGANAYNQAQFKPFTVTTGMGTTNAGPNGFSTQLNAQQQGAQNQLFNQGLGMLGSATTGLPERQQAIYDQLAAARAPGNQRAALELEQRMFNQGRSGVNTSAYGGTPEQLAMAKAMQEQQSADLFNARNQGLNEMTTEANVGNMLFNSSYIPQNMLMNTQGLGNQLASFATTANQQGVVTQGELQKQGLIGLLQGETNAGNLQMQQYKMFADILNGRQTDENGNPIVNPDASLLRSIFSGIGGLFGGQGA